jgi:hypothetical protein
MLHHSIHEEEEKRTLLHFLENGIALARQPRDEIAFPSNFIIRNHQISRFYS